VNALALAYDLVLVDCCVRGGPAVRMLAARANTCLLAITPDARRLPQAAELVTALGAIGVREVPVVIDRATTRDEAATAFAALAAQVAAVPSGKDVKVRELADVRRDDLPGTNATWLEPVLVHAPRSNAAEELRKVARTIAAPPAPPPSATQGLSRRLGQLFERARAAAALPIT
jgi:cellulose biosynthesis protein BcsQ